MEKLVTPIGRAVLLFLVHPPAVAARQDAVASSCFTSRCVSTLRDTEPIRCRPRAGILRWRRVTRLHTALDGPFVEAYRAVVDSIPSSGA